MDLNVFNLYGPEFLFFYVIAGIFTCFLTRALINKFEANLPMPQIDLKDPYEIALLRGGAHEALRVAAFSLLDRGLLEISAQNQILAKNAFAGEVVRRPIERAVLKCFSTSGAITTLNNEDIKAVCAINRANLENQSLLANHRIMNVRLKFTLLALCVILGIAGTKVVLAIKRGHSNFIFLLTLAVIFSIFLFKIHSRQRTVLGDRALEDLRSLMTGLKNRTASLASGGATNEATLIAAIFGLSTLSKKQFPFLSALQIKRKENGSLADNIDWDCGSSCGLSSGLSDSSSCGGGCGGGCGGCGS